MRKHEHIPDVQNCEHIHETPVMLRWIRPSFGAGGFAWHMFAINGANDMREVPSLQPIVRNLTPFLFSGRASHLLINIHVFLYYGLTYFSSNLTGGFVWQPSEIRLIPHVPAFGSWYQVLQGYCNIKTRLQSFNQFLEQSHEAVKGTASSMSGSNSNWS